MPECQACGATTRAGMKVCAACKAPIRRQSAYRDPRHGLCEYNDHGTLCNKAGSISLQIGEDAPWYCRDHAFGLRGIKPQKAGPQNIKSHMKPWIEPDDESRIEREAIQSEAQK